jgi:hypothetical protein
MGTSFFHALKCCENVGKYWIQSWDCELQSPAVEKFTTPRVAKCVLKRYKFLLRWESAPAHYNTGVAVVNSEDVGLALGPNLTIVSYNGSGVNF